MVYEPTTSCVRQQREKSMELLNVRKGMLIMKKNNNTHNGHGHSNS